MKLTLVLCVISSCLTSSAQESRHHLSSRIPARVKVWRHHSTVVWSCGSSGVDTLVYEAGFAVDADGAPRAYHPDNARGLDSIEHAGQRGNWWALATDTGKTSGHPVVQGKDDPAPGYYVSMTALFDASKPDERDPRRFVDATTIPYVVLPPVGLRHADLGDFATVVNLQNGKVAGAIVADESAPDLKMGEGSMALADALGIDSNPRTGGTRKRVAYIIYPGSGNGKPRHLKDISYNSRRRFQRWGGVQKLDACLR